MDRRDEDVRAEIERLLASASRFEERACELEFQAEQMTKASKRLWAKAMRLRLSRLDLEATLKETPDAER